jgi:hypothetical protein
VTTPDDKPRRPGRPRRADGPVDYNAIDKLVVSGEDVMGPDGERRHRFPSFREIAGRFGVAHSLVAKYAREHNCVERRAYATTVKPGRPRREFEPVVVPKQAPRRTPRVVEAVEKDAASPGTELVVPPPQYTPRQAGEPVDTHALDLWLVHGEAVPIKNGTGFAIVYPSHSEICRRLGITRSELHAYAKEHDCDRRRAEVEARVRAKVDQKLVELRADAIAVTRERKLQIVDTYIEQFYDALRDGRVRTDSVQDFNTMIRLRSFLEGGADQRTELLGGLTLDDLRSRHAEFLRDRDGDTAATVGVVEAEIVAVEATDPAHPEIDHSSDQ